MKRLIKLAVGCLLGVTLAAALMGGLRGRAQVVATKPLAVESGGVVINEVAWMGTQARSWDEWIELHNTGGVTVSLSGWTLSFADGSPITITLDGEIGPGAYFLLERDDEAISDLDADLVYGGGQMSNGGEQMELRDGSGAVIDTANGEGGAWPAGTDSSGVITYAAMERVDPTAPDSDDNWCTNDGITCNGSDSDGFPINGTPGAQNSCYQPPVSETADLVVAKTGPLSIAPGDQITYRIALSNTGAVTATGVRLTDALPSCVEFITQTSPFTFSWPSVLVWEVGHVPTGTLHLITVTGRVSEVVDPFTNRVTATTDVYDLMLVNNYATWRTLVESGLTALYLPLVLRDYVPPPYNVIIEAALYDGLQVNDDDEAVLITNGGYVPVELSGWELCKWYTSDWRCTELPEMEIAPQQRVWLARSEAGFSDSFGFAPHHVLSGWPVFSNEGDEVVLRDDDGVVRDALVYEQGTSAIAGWDGPTVQPYGGANFAEEGQVLYRYHDEETGRPAADTDTAADWAQYWDDPWRGRRVRYPGWDLEDFFEPELCTTTGTVTVGIAPDNAYDVVVDTIRAARERIELETYTLEHYDLVNELVQKANEGVSVTVLLEGGPVGGVDDQELWACQKLHATGKGLCYFMVNSDTLRIYDRYTFLHAKFMIVDRERVLLGSQNLTHTSLPGDDKGNGTGGSRGAVLAMDAAGIVTRAVEVFEADCDPDNHQDISLWGPDNALGYGAPPPDFAPHTGGDWMTYTVQFSQPLTVTADWFELVTAPEAALRSGDGLLGLIAQAGAGDGVYIEQLYEYADWGDAVSAPNLRLEAYIDAARRGARVRILLNGGNFGIEELSLTKNVEAAAYVNAIAQDEGLDLSAHLGDPTQYGIHNKMVLANLGGERKFVHVGSINGSETSNKANREMALQVESAALYDYLYAMFDYDWNLQPPLGHLLISEVMYNPSGNDTGLEWIELYNPTVENVDLSGWHLGDVGPGGEYGSGLYRFPEGALLPAGGVILIAQQANDVAFAPDYEFLIDPHRDAGSVPNMVPAGSWDGFGLALGNVGDEVLLLDDTGVPVDVVAYAAGSYPGVTPHPGVSAQGHSLERRPPERDTDDCAQDFYDRYPPTPGELTE